jgi:hypothetical protein
MSTPAGIPDVPGGKPLTRAIGRGANVPYAALAAKELASTRARMRAHVSWSSLHNRAHPCRAEVINTCFEHSTSSWPLS